MNSTPELEKTASKGSSKKGAKSTLAPSELGDKLLAIGDQRIHVNAVTTKIRDDIAFLEDRILRMEKMKNPSETVLNTYKAMLDSRKSVLQWLKEHDMITTPPASVKRA
ncbi:hypothetical protein SAMN02745866_01316 [Alteromonadaceae bacterium Bs31]|nr:hypothetical protein SAMN02745866_01316 [Alteromonadaceae bacterium Bs31]